VTDDHDPASSPSAAPRPPAADAPPSDGGRTAGALVELLDTLVTGAAVPDFAFRSTELAIDLLSVDDVGVVVGDGRSRLRLVASSSRVMASIEIDEIALEEGPCMDAFTQRTAVVHHDLLDGGIDRWPRFAPIAVAAGFASVYAVPLRYRDICLGAMNLFAHRPTALDADELALGQALADATSLALTQDRLRASEDLVVQLQGALDSRVLIEQAKGMVAEQLDLDVDQAFALIRAAARRTGRTLTDICTGVIDRSLSGPDLQG
jgi:GAF domain-containing protein